MWVPVGSGQRLQNLSNWPADTKARALRPYKNFLVALDVVKSGTRYPQMVKWSDPAEPGAVPPSWDPASPTNRAGEYSLSETNDYCVDCLTLRDLNVIYKEATTWGMQLIGGTQVFRFFKMFDSVGIIGQGCAVEYFSGQHVAFSPDDIVAHDGQNARSILTRRMKRFVFNRIAGAYAARSFVALNYNKREVWFCYPTGAATLPNEVLVWNFAENTLTVRELPNIAHAQQGVVDVTQVAGGATWNVDTETWPEDTTVWDESNFNPAIRGMLLAAPEVTKLFKADETAIFHTTPMTAYAETKGIGIPARNVDNPPDISTPKMCRRIWPRITGTNGGVVKVYVGSHESYEDTPVYAPAKDYVIGTTKSLDFKVTGRLMAVKFESTTNISWKMSGYTIDIISRGQY